MGKTAIKICDCICIKHQRRKVLKVGGPIRKIENFSIAKIEFLWRALKFKRGHMAPLAPSFPLPMAKRVLYIRAIINIEKSHFEILITVYLENA